MINKKLSLNGLTFKATKINVSNNILTITLNRPEKKNALNNVMVNEINYALAYAKQEREIRVVVIAAEGDIFCAGADLNQTESDSNVPKLDGAEDISIAIRHLYKPVICKIQGSVLAGALLMVTNATHAIANKEAKFSAPEIKPVFILIGMLLPIRLVSGSLYVSKAFVKKYKLFVPGNDITFLSLLSLTTSNFKFFF